MAAIKANTAQYAAATQPNWQDRAALYEKLTGGATRRIAATVLNRHLFQPLTPSTHILDLASGPGVVTELLLARARASAPPRITAVDVSPGMMAQYAEKAAALGWTTATWRVLDAAQLTGLADGEFDAVVMNFALFAVPDAARATAEMRRVLKPGGVALVTTWKTAGTVRVLEAACRAVRPADLGRVLPVEARWMEEGTLRDALVAGGFAEEEVKIETVGDFWVNESAEAFVDAMTSPFWQRITQGWSEEEVARWKPAIQKAAGAPEEDGSVRKEMVAWVGIARKTV